MAPKSRTRFERLRCGYSKEVVGMHSISGLIVGPRSSFRVDKECWCYITKQERIPIFISGWWWQCVQLCSIRRLLGILHESHKKPHVPYEKLFSQHSNAINDIIPQKLRGIYPRHSYCRHGEAPMDVVKSGHLETQYVQTFSYLEDPRKTPWLSKISTSGFQVRKSLRSVHNSSYTRFDLDSNRP